MSPPGQQALRADRRKIGTVGRDVDELLPDSGGFTIVSLQNAHITEIQVGGYGPAVQVDGAIEATDRLRIILPSYRLEANLVLEKRQNRLVPWFGLDVRQLR